MRHRAPWPRSVNARRTVARQMVRMGDLDARRQSAAWPAIRRRYSSNNGHPPIIRLGGRFDIGGRAVIERPHRSKHRRPALRTAYAACTCGIPSRPTWHGWCYYVDTSRDASALRAATSRTPDTWGSGSDPRRRGLRRKASRIRRSKYTSALAFS